MSNPHKRPLRMVDIHLTCFDIAESGSLVGEFAIIEPDGKMIEVLDQSSIDELSDEEITLVQHSIVKKLANGPHKELFKSITRPATSNFIGHEIGLLFSDIVIEHATKILCPNTDDLEQIPLCYITADVQEAHEAADRVKDVMACNEHELQYRLSAAQRWFIDAYEDAYKPILQDVEYCLKDYGFSVVTTKNKIYLKQRISVNEIWSEQ